MRRPILTPRRLAARRRAGAVLLALLSVALLTACADRPASTAAWLKLPACTTPMKSVMTRALSIICNQ